MISPVPAVNTARSVTQHQVNGITNVLEYIDLHQLVDQVALNITDATIDAAVAAVVQDLTNAIYERHSHNLERTAYGLGINFPPNL